MTSAQCVSGAIWAACAVDLYQLYGAPGVVGFLGMSALIGSYFYRRMFKKGHRHDA